MSTTKRSTASMAYSPHSTEEDGGCPVEILDRIFAFVDNHSLTNVALASRTFYGVSCRIIYRHIPSLPLPRTVLCLRTLATNPDLANFARTYEVGSMDTLDADRATFLMAPFYHLLIRAVHNMPHIVELQFLLDDPTSFILTGAPFRLTKLTTTCNFDPTFAAWLEEQPTLHRIHVYGPFISGTTLRPDALPEPHRISSSPLVLACVIPGRQVRDVELCLVQPWLLNREVIGTLVQVMSYADRPLESFQLIGHLTEPADVVISALKPIPAGLQSLSHLSLNAISGSITSHFLADFPSIISKFISLKSITLISKNKYDALHDHMITRTLASSWHAKCPSLQRLSLPYATWLQSRDHGWVTIEQLQRILAEKERTLMERERRVIQREAMLRENQRRLEMQERDLIRKVETISVANVDTKYNGVVQ
ncbi:hypothetical protein OF83DRAFT_1169030 [Amylostereum chailletii]|nr:hypothetical protein OF83DRAFT_1169030 [Amylostereum chailletii]